MLLRFMCVRTGSSFLSVLGLFLSIGKFFGFIHVARFYWVTQISFFSATFYFMELRLDGWLFIYLFIDIGSHCSPGWHQTHDIDKWRFSSVESLSTAWAIWNCLKTKTKIQRLKSKSKYVIAWEWGNDIETCMCQGFTAGGCFTTGGFHSWDLELEQTHIPFLKISCHINC